MKTAQIFMNELFMCQEIIISRLLYMISHMSTLVHVSSELKCVPYETIAPLTCVHVCLSIKFILKRTSRVSMSRFVVRCMQSMLISGKVIVRLIDRFF